MEKDNNFDTAEFWAEMNAKAKARIAIEDKFINCLESINSELLRLEIANIGNPEIHKAAKVINEKFDELVATYDKMDKANYRHLRNFLNTQLCSDEPVSGILLQISLKDFKGKGIRKHVKLAI